MGAAALEPEREGAIDIGKGINSVSASRNVRGEVTLMPGPRSCEPFFSLQIHNEGIKRDISIGKRPKIAIGTP